MITPQNPNMISWSVSRSYEHKREAGSMLLEGMDAASHPSGIPLVRLFLGLLSLLAAR